MVLSISEEEGVIAVNNFIAQYGLTYPFMLDPAGDIGRLYRVRTTPTTFFLDGDGVIRNIQAGFVTQSWVEANIQRFPLLGG